MLDVSFVGPKSDPVFQIGTFNDRRRVLFVTTLFTASVAAADEFRGNDEATAWDRRVREGCRQPGLPRPG